MLERGILNPAINALLSRVRHTNTLVIADRGFPFWPGIETIDISLVDGIPLVLEVLAAIRAQSRFGAAYMAEEPGCKTYLLPSNRTLYSRNGCR
jgi:D-ribose pyranase